MMKPKQIVNCKNNNKTFSLDFKSERKKTPNLLTSLVVVIVETNTKKIPKRIKTLQVIIILWYSQNKF